MPSVIFGVIFEWTTGMSIMTSCASEQRAAQAAALATWAQARPQRALRMKGVRNDMISGMAIVLMMVIANLDKSARCHTKTPLPGNSD